MFSPSGFGVEMSMKDLFCPCSDPPLLVHFHLIYTLITIKEERKGGSQIPSTSLGEIVCQFEVSTHCP